MRHKKLFALLLVMILAFSGLYLFYGLNPATARFALNRRIPNLVAMGATGISIAVSSMIFQTITNNRIITPSILGLDALYLLIQTVLVFFFGSAHATVVRADLNFLLSTILMIAFSLAFFKLLFALQKNLLVLLMAGMIFGTLFGSLSSFFQMVIDPNEFFIIQNRMFASFNNVNRSILGVAIFLTLLTLIWVAKELRLLDVLALGRDAAINLGIDYEKNVRKFLIAVAILVATSTALVGAITFLGLLVANLAYQLFNDYRHKVLISGAILISMLALIGGQFLVERVFGFTTTIGVVINFIGGIYFIYLLTRETRV